MRLCLKSLHPLWRLRRATYYTKVKEKRKTSGQAWLLFAGVTTALSSATVYYLGKPEEVIEGLNGNDEPVQYCDENTIKAYFLRARDRLTEIKSTFSEPSSAKLLPDLLPPPYQRPYTLVLELNDLLIHTDYDRSVGWKYQKRPGVDALLASLFDYYEIVLFTSETAMTGNSIVTALDPNNLIMYKLFKDSTKYVDGQHIKDLNALNRSLNRVIIVDTNKEAVKLHPLNAIILEKWTGDITDRTLWDLISFLQTIADNNVEDTRPVLDYYKDKAGGSQILETFKLYQAQVMAEEERNRQIQALRNESKVGKISTFSLWRGRNHKDEDITSSLPVPEPAQKDATAVPKQESVPHQSWTEWIGSWIGWK